VFVLDGTTATAHYNYLQDLANLNMPAGEIIKPFSLHFVCGCGPEWDWGGAAEWHVSRSMSADSMYYAELE
jgi:hypothetical protein